MTAGGWERWTLGLAVAAVIPITMGGAACGGKSDSPEPSAGRAGMTAVSGSGGSASGGTSSGGSASGGNATGGISGNPSAGQAAGGVSDSGDGGTAGSPTTPCCNPSVDRPHCTADGRSVHSCWPGGGVCAERDNPYAYGWTVIACESGCIEVGGSGGAGGDGTGVSHCNAGGGGFSWGGYGGRASGGAGGAATAGSTGSGGDGIQAGVCCQAGAGVSCSPDGLSLRTCASGASSCGSTSVYAYAWDVTACPSRCVGGGGGSAGPHCE